MPPSKKKKNLMRGPFSPSSFHHLYNNPHLHNSLHSDPKCVIEQLFLLRRFDDALELSYGILSELCNRDEDEDRMHKNKQPMQVTDEFAEPQDKIMHLTHSCKDSELCECSKIVVLVIQIMFEMGKAPLATPFACKFYRDVKCVPYDIVFVCVNLLVNSLANFPEAKRILTTALDTTKINQQGLVTIPQFQQVVVHTPEQREILMEFLLFHVMAPLNDIQEAIDILERDKTISPAKKEGWTSCLNEIHKANLIKAQQQQQSQQQSPQTQSQSPPHSNNPHSSPVSSPNNFNKTNSSSSSSSHQSPSLSPVSSSLSPSTVAINYCKSLVATSKRATSQLWAYIRKLAQSRFGSVAFGIAVVWIVIHLFTSFRRRNSSPSPLIEDIQDEEDSTSNNNNNYRRTDESRRKTTTTNNYNNNNNNKQLKQTTKTKAPKRQQQHYGGVDQIGGGFWSSVTELLSTALSLK